ncbi:hypothetical protein BJ878DRAFT_203087 [Calycina marina]|uniref:C2H2-type domain-containing protein n=1 Tax=Calycina marina TaxID=1763456 RepID=A0A9P7YXN6_9HELO|nr:hypothetical protein BJ878DRAFT_203087 [Calycina marina]
MASSKDIPHSSRPLSQHRLSMSANSGSLPRPSHARNHSHSVSSGSLIPNSRVSRRKSVSTNAASNVAAMVAAAQEAGDSLGIPVTNRIKSMNRVSRSAVGSLPSPPASLQSTRMRISSGKLDKGESAIDDEMDEDMEDKDGSSFNQSRIRSASEGHHLTKDGKKASSGDLKCEKCGKGYKHSSCLTKHLWEHTPEWSLTSKLLISKHQQVQLLEAASILLNLNQDGTPADSSKDFGSDQESASPVGSGSSDQHDGTSSADTTPPPQGDMYSKSAFGSSYSNRHQRNSSGYGYSGSYQSAPSAHSNCGSSVPTSAFGHHSQSSREPRPLSSGMNRNAEDDGLAAAVELLSCSFGSNGTPRTMNIPMTLPEDAPPVPNIPAQYLNEASYPNFSGTTLAHSMKPLHQESYTRGEKHLERDVKMEESEESVVDDEDYDQRSRGRSDEDDDGVFGRMEE